MRITTIYILSRNTRVVSPISRRLPSIDGVRLTLAGIGSLVAIIAAGSVILPDTVYDRFVWKYFIGPVTADAQGTASVVRDGVVAHSGYTLVNEVGYGLLLVAAILLLMRVLRWYDTGGGRNFVLAFTPFIVAGGVLRVVEDAGVVGLPYGYLFISPIIYGTVFVAAFAALLGGIHVERRGYGSWRRTVAGTGTVIAAAGFGLLLLHAPTPAWWIPVVMVGGAALLTAPVVYMARPFTGSVTGLRLLASWEGAAVLFGHMLDGVATAVSLASLGYGEKHPVVLWFVNTAGTPYAFIPLKLAVVTGILYALGREDRAEEPVFFNLILLGILILGLAPGVRDMIRAMFGV